MCNLSKAKDPLSVQEKHKLPCKIKCLDDKEKVPVESFPLLITDSQGLIEIHISRLQFCTSVSILHIFRIYAYRWNKINSYAVNYFIFFCRISIYVDIIDYLTLFLAYEINYV